MELHIELSYKVISSTGLFLDSIGADLIYKFGLPQNLNRDGYNVLIQSRKRNQSELKKVLWFDIYSTIGIGSLITGFTLQLGANWL